jgi:hypothetical protein
MAFWTRLAMPKGQSTMLGRIMAGSHALSAHQAVGQALVVASQPPATPLSQVMVASGPKGVEATGITRFVIDRAVQAVALACAFAQQGWGVLCLLDDHEHAGLDRFDAPRVDRRAAGTRVESGPWQVPRPEAPRHCVIVAPAAGQTLVYWGTAQGRETCEVSAWPQVYRARRARQEHSFTRMMAHGALQSNYGRKKKLGAARPQQRAREQLDHALEVAQQRVATQGKAGKAPQAKVVESASQGHGKRLEPRQRPLAGLEKTPTDAPDKQDQRAAQAVALGAPGERADRDGRTQTIMTGRTWL